MGKLLLDKDASLIAFQLFLNEHFCDLRGKNAALHIVECTAPHAQSIVANEAIVQCLKVYWDSFTKPALVRNIDALLLALAITRIAPIDTSVARRLVHTVAVAGIHGRFPELPERLLGQPMSGDEVVALISAYVENRASRCEADEEKYRGWATKYLSPADARTQHARLDRFVEEWENQIDL